jgi:hypothetical protein
VQLPVLQSVAEAHTIDPGHAVVAPAVQAWLLLQVLLVSIEVLVLHDGVPQSEPIAAKWHPPVPLQVPSVPHGSVTSGQAPCGSAALAAVTGRHVPVVVVACPFKAAVHALQPVHSLSQQTPSAIIPNAHS